DRFHIVAKMNKALDEVRAGESRRMRSEGRAPVLKKFAVAVAKTPRESQRGTALPPPRSAPLQPEDCPRLPSEGKLSATLGLRLPHLGREVPRRMVSPSHALPYRADEENRPLPARASRVDPQLFPRSETAFQRRRRGFEQQGQSHHEKIVRLSHP